MVLAASAGISAVKFTICADTRARCIGCRAQQILCPDPRGWRVFPKCFLIAFHSGLGRQPGFLASTCRRATASLPLAACQIFPQAFISLGPGTGSASRRAYPVKVAICSNWLTGMDLERMEAKRLGDPYLPREHELVQDPEPLIFADGRAIGTVRGGVIFRQ